ncbi:DUF7282 domain-containing protein [Limibacillus halophilus]|jgi:hypothetical protein
MRIKSFTLSTAFAAALVGFAAAPALADHLKVDTSNVEVKGNSLVFAMVKIDKPGFLVIHATKDGQPVVPGSIGHTFVSTGTTGDVMVELTEKPMMGATYIAMLHEDSGQMGVYEFGEGMTEVDPPALKADGSPYALPVKLGM